MIVVQLRDADSKELRREWKVESIEKFPNISVSMFRGNNLWSVYATGPSLDALKETFGTLPMPKTAMEACWTGDLAAFIINNIQYSYVLATSVPKEKT